MNSRRALRRRNLPEKQIVACQRGIGERELRPVADGQHAFATLVAMAGRHGKVTLLANRAAVPMPIIADRPCAGMAMPRRASRMHFHT